MRPSTDDQLGALIFIGVIVLIVYLGKWKWRPKGKWLGNAEWASDKLLKNWGLLGERGLMIGRTLSGELIRIPDAVHVLCIGGTRSGKTVGLAIPTLLSYAKGSCVVFDAKAELFRIAGGRRARAGIKNVVLNPFGGNTDTWNVLDIVKPGPLLFNQVRMIADALVPISPEEHDKHWSEKAVQTIAAVLVYITCFLEDQYRNLNSVQTFVSNSSSLLHMAEGLIREKGVYGNYGGQLKLLFDGKGMLTEEGSSVLSVCTRALAFLDSPVVADSVRSSTFDARSLLKPGTTLYLQIPPKLLSSFQGLLRCWVACLISETMDGVEGENEILYLLDEANTLAELRPLYELLVRGAGSGLRAILIYQSYGQAAGAFRAEPTVVEDNCRTQLYLNAGSIETGNRLAQMIGNHTVIVESLGENWTDARAGEDSTRSTGGSMTYAQQGVPLLRAENALRMSSDLFIAFHGGFPCPILGTKLRWFSDPHFFGGKKKKRRFKLSTQKWATIGLVLFFGAIFVRLHYRERDHARPTYERMNYGQDRTGPRGSDGPAGAEGTEKRLQPKPTERGGRRPGPVRQRDPRGNRPGP